MSDLNTSILYIIIRKMICIQSPLLRIGFLILVFHRETQVVSFDRLNLAFTSGWPFQNFAKIIERSRWQKVPPFAGTHDFALRYFQPEGELFQRLRVHFSFSPVQTGQGWEGSPSGGGKHLTVTSSRLAKKFFIGFRLSYDFDGR